jgi:hypothetical protein
MIAGKILRRVAVAAVTAAMAALPCVLPAQQAQKPLTNADIASMVKLGLPAQPILDLINCRASAFDVSPQAKAGLFAAGGPARANDMKRIWQAMTAAKIAQGTNGRGGENAGSCSPPTAPSNAPGAAPASAAAAAQPPRPHWAMPTVALLAGGSMHTLPMERTQLAQTKTKPQSLAGLAEDTAVTQGLQAGISDATQTAAEHMSSQLGGSAVMQAGTIFGGLMGHRTPEVTYVWGVPGPASANVLQTTMPKFDVDFARAPGVNPDEFAPEIVKLTPAQNTCRLVGATRGKQDAASHDAADWQVYSGFVEDRVGVERQKQAAGHYSVTPASPLVPGEYAVVLRPVRRNQKFSGGDVSRGQGAGLMFAAVWTFSVADTAQ